MSQSDHVDGACQRRSMLTHSHRADHEHPSNRDDGVHVLNSSSHPRHTVTISQGDHIDGGLDAFYTLSESPRRP